ncbi:TonB-dependent receptor plug domain-containing protein [Ferribacterium limneticum]|uniref:TonB-dependent receptor plug domain-containing protein n=1 Tax=Ferribacterium limneticum TaxID=76259 RepID=UPI001CFA0DE3|nr:TonB-dependent receptor [Ferribacterium limneticum]UCV20563.1 TonB-dependent receptor [Ferribacterium limneticum]
MNLGRLKQLNAALCLTFFAGAVLAESAVDLTELPLEQLMLREAAPVAQIAQQISDSPSAVSIVTAADIRAYGYRTLADVINSMRGLYTTYDRRYQYMGGRGFGAAEDYAGRIMLLIDGYATQDSLFNQAYIDESGLLDLELVERVEYVPGTGSVTYGNNAMLGIINVVTKKGRDFNAAQLSGEVSSHGGQKQRATYGKRFDNGADLLLSVSALDIKGRNLYFPAYDTPGTNNGIADNLDSETNKRVFGKFSYQGLTVEGGYVDRKKMLPTNPSESTTFNTPFSVRDENAFLNLAYQTTLASTLSSQSRFYSGHYAYDTWREFPDYLIDNEKYGRREYHGQWWGIDQKFVGNWFIDHTMVFGFEFRNDYRQQFRRTYLSPEKAVVEVFSDSLSRRTGSFYLTDEYWINEHWSLNVGARYDDASDLAGNWSPRLAVIYKPTVQTTLKASYSEAFRMPHAYERFSYDGSAVPEYVAASELALQHEFTRNMRLTASLYNYDRSSLLIYNDALGDYVPEGNSRTQGLEVELERMWENGIRSRGSLAWQNARDVYGAEAVNSPHVLGKFNLSFPMFDNRLRTGLEAQYLGSRLTLERRRLAGVGLANLTFSSERKWHGLSASFSIRNLFDREYEAVSPFDWRPDSGLAQDSLRMDGRTYWFQLNVDL